MPNDFLKNTHWAILPEYLDTVDQIISAKLNGEKLDLDAIEAYTGKKLDNHRLQYEIIDGVAVIPVIGAIGKRMNMFTRLSGGASTELVRKDMSEAINDRQVRAIVLNVDSPGGTVDGTVELADWIHAQRGNKPIYAYANGQMASAAYWIGAAADKIFGYSSAQIGSIGVVGTHYDYSVRDESRGVKRTMVTAGKYKRIAADNEPLTEEGQQYLQSAVDKCYSLFVEGIATCRGVAVDKVITDMADGRIFLAKEALERGMIDTIGTLEDTINAARTAATKGVAMPLRAKADQFKNENPEAAALLVAEGREAATVENADAIKVAVTGESARLQGVYSALHGADPGTKFTKLADSGLTVEQIEALDGAGLKLDTSKDQKTETSSTEQQSRKELLAALEKTGQDSPGADSGNGGPADFMAAVDAHMEANSKLTKTKAMSAMAKKHKDLHKAYLEQANK